MTDTPYDYTEEEDHGFVDLPEDLLWTEWFLSSALGDEYSYLLQGRYSEEDLEKINRFATYMDSGAIPHFHDNVELWDWCWLGSLHLDGFLYRTDNEWASVLFNFLSSDPQVEKVDQVPTAKEAGVAFARTVTKMVAVSTLWSLLLWVTWEAVSLYSPSSYGAFPILGVFVAVVLESLWATGEDRILTSLPFHIVTLAVSACVFLVIGLAFGLGRFLLDLV